MQWRQVLLPASIAGTVLALTTRKPVKQKLPSNTLRAQKATTVIQRFMIRNGVPGLSVGVTLNGRRTWSAGFGLADVEQMVPCTGRTVMRIASISKAITAVIAARLVQEGKLDLDAPIQKYVPNFPKKYFDGEAVEITSRQLLCHTSGIRHYKEGDRQGIEPSESADGIQGEIPEFLSNKHYKSVSDALEMFKDSDLISKPGAKFNYTTHGFTLLSAVLEKAADSSFTKQASHLFKELGMNHTFLDDNRNIVPNRSRYYYRDRNHKLKNVPEVDNSYKWAGGGLLSNVDDLLIFADAMLYCFHASRYAAQPYCGKSLLSPEVLSTFWKGEVDGGRGYEYALGWYKSRKEEAIEGAHNGWARNGFWMHTGAAVGASSVLLIKPDFHGSLKGGICIAVIVNLHDCGELTLLALEIAEIFQNYDESEVSAICES